MALFHLSTCEQILLDYMGNFCYIYRQQQKERKTKRANMLTSDSPALVSLTTDSHSVTRGTFRTPLARFM